jgi:imidazolonepropionase-like amidohydrolase
MLKTLAACLLAAAPLTADTVLIRNVNVIPMNRPAVLSGQNVIVTDGRIADVSTRMTKLPEGTKVIDGTGKYLIPGLAEMHGHIPPPSAPADAVATTLFLYVANGITTVRGMLGAAGQLELREKANSGQILAPTLYLAGPSFNGQSVNSPEEAVTKVKQQKKEGWNLLKVHPGLTREEYDAMAVTARQQKIRFGGHVPEAVGLLRAIEAGQETFDHVDGYVEYLNGDQGPVDEKKLADVVARTKKAGAWIVPTMALWEVLYNTIPLDTLRSYSELKYAPQTAVQNWATAYANRQGQVPPQAAKNVIENRKRVLRALHEGGVKILMGTDAPQQFSIPGFSLHRELTRMRDAGMSPYEILKSGTKNVGEYFANEDSFGTIEKGKRADLILLAANPLDDIQNVSRIDGVMVRGRWLSRADLDDRLEKIEEKYRRPAS